MRALVIALILAAGCGGKQPAASGPPAAVAAAFPAARWIPEKPTYVVAARTMREAQRAFADIVDTVGMAFGAETSQISAGLTQMLAVDPLSPDAVAAIGVDLEGGMALYSEDVNPTFVVHLSSQEALQAFLDRQRERGLVTRSVIVDGTEVFTTNLSSDLRISWAVDQSWLWVHFAIGTRDDGTAWFTQSKRPTGAAWVGRWEAAQKLATKRPGLVGFFDIRELLAKAATREPAAAACARQFEAVSGAGVVIESEGKYVGGRLAFELGGAAQAIAGNVLPLPAGWTAAQARAPIAAQWNLDVRTVAGLVQSCMAKVDDRGNTVGGGPDLVGFIDQYGVRSARAFVHAFDPDKLSGVGAASLDLTHSRFFARLLDEIPLRSKFEKSRAYGPYKGKHLSVPFVVTLDYVLDDRVGMIAMGDGLLAKAASGGAGAPPAVMTIDLLPQGLPVSTWEWLLAQVDLPSPRRFAERLQSWQDLHVGAVIDRDRLVIEASGNRR